MKNLLLAIETSCDETAVSLFDTAAAFQGKAFNECLLVELLASSAQLHEAYGGVVPELAAREQVLTLPPLLKRALDTLGASTSDLGFIAVTTGPGLNGSLLVGHSLARGLAYGLNVPLLSVNHLEGHLAAHALLPYKDQLSAPYLALLVSGGHTELLLIDDNQKNALLCRTRDDAAGEAFDKCATLLGLPYPGGPALSELATGGDRNRFTFPIGVADDPVSFSFSGLKTAVQREITKLGVNLKSTIKQDLAASVERAIVEALVIKCLYWAKERKVKGIFVTGGVAANTFLRDELKAKCGQQNLQFAASDFKHTTDNATMIGAAALKMLIANRQTFTDWQQSPGAELGPGFSYATPTRPSWPVA